MVYSYVFLLTQTYVHTKIIHLSSNLFSESIWCQIPLANGDCLPYGLIYRSPDSDIGNFNNLCSLLTQTTNTGVSHLLIVGDFNMSLEYTYISVTSNIICDGAFLTLLDDLFFTRHVKFPMRYRNNQTPSLLDLTLSIDQHAVSNVTSLPCPLLAKVITLSSALNFCVIILLIVSMCPSIYMDVEIMNP